MSRRLHGVRVEQHAPLAAHAAYLRYRLYRAYLVVRVHDRHQAGVRAYGGGQLLHSHESVAVDVQQRDFKALLLQL